MIKGLELFAGIGGWKRALDNLGIKNEVHAIENDEKTINVYNCIHSKNEYKQDIRNVNAENQTDVIFMSPPCQNYSKAKQCSKRTTDNLIAYTLPIIKKCKPRYVIIENVPQFQKSKDYQDFRQTMYVDLGYQSHEKILNPIDYNWPQNRPRFFEIWFRDYKDFKNYKWPEKEKLTLRVIDIIGDLTKESYKWNVIPKNAKLSKAGNSIYWGKYIDNRCFKTTHFIGTITATFNQPMIANDTNVFYRKLIVDECWLLMGYPISSFKKVKETYPKLSDSSLKRMAGNSLVIPLIQKLLINIEWS